MRPSRSPAEPRRATIDSPDRRLTAAWRRGREMTWDAQRGTWIPGPAAPYQGAPQGAPQGMPQGMPQAAAPSAFAGVPVGDHVRDGAAALLLILSLTMPWDGWHAATSRRATRPTAWSATGSAAAPLRRHARGHRRVPRRTRWALPPAASPAASPAERPAEPPGTERPGPGSTSLAVRPRSSRVLSSTLRSGDGQASRWWHVEARRVTDLASFGLVTCGLVGATHASACNASVNQVQ